MTNTLEEANLHTKVPAPCIMVIFGVTGDLTARKLMPALYNLAREKQLPSQFACVGFARRDKTNETFRTEMHDAVNQFSRVKPVDEKLWSQFQNQLFYHQSNFDDDAGYESLRNFLDDLDKKFGTKGNRVFYLSTQPSYFTTIVDKLHEHKMIYPLNDPEGRWSRVVIEKPFGEDLASAIDLQQNITKALDESQIYRIDHYLGKETVQNLLVFRFCNPIFEAVWNNRYIDHVQISVSEDIGIGTRGRFWEEAGILRDIVQNHMMQLLSLVAMEPPVNLSPESIHNEKVKVMQSIRAFPKDKIDDFVIRGQYGPGKVNGTPAKGYREEDNVAKDSNVETFMAMELSLDSWRWGGVPFYLRAGKRLPKKTTEIAITFKKAPGCLFQMSGRAPEANMLVINIQPNEGISFKMNCKVPGFSNVIQPVLMDFKYESYFGVTPPEAYERLICDCMSGDATLFARVDEVLASWKLLTPVLERWKKETPKDFPNYASGTWGPKAADELLTRSGREWHKM